MTVYLGEIRAFAGDLPPGWLPCDGRLLSIDQNPATYAVIGTAYGGNGTTTFALPDLRGRVLAGADKRDDENDQDPGALSGREDKDAALIPYAVVRWGIAVQGTFPQRD
jgi:microcystin-dependent protein